MSGTSSIVPLITWVHQESHLTIAGIVKKTIYKRDIKKISVNEELSILPFTNWGHQENQLTIGYCQATDHQQESHPQAGYYEEPLAIGP